MTILNFLIEKFKFKLIVLKPEMEEREYAFLDFYNEQWTMNESFIVQGLNERIRFITFLDCRLRSSIRN